MKNQLLNLLSSWFFIEVFMQKHPLFDQLYARLSEPRKFMQVLLGPRQVGKTTLALQVADALDKPTHYVSADIATLQDLAWIEQQWEIAR